MSRNKSNDLRKILWSRIFGDLIKESSNVCFDIKNDVRYLQQNSFSP
jgi:hypothetical protein